MHRPSRLSPLLLTGLLLSSGLAGPDRALEPVPSRAPSALRSVPPPAQGLGQSRRELRNWLRALEVGSKKAEVDAKREERLNGYLATLRKGALSDPDLRLETRELCLDLASIGRSQPDLPVVDEGGWPLPAAYARTVAHRLGERNLRLMLEREPDGGQAWLALDVLNEPKQPLDRRLGALDVLRAQHSALGLDVILKLLDGGAGRLQSWLQRALVGWPDPRVDAWLTGQFAASEGQDPVAFRYLELHLRSRPDGLPIEAQAALTPLVGPLLASSDWRDASRGLALTAHLDALTGVPFLIDALERWGTLAEQEPGVGGRRIQNDVVEALKARSGRSLGGNPAVWRQWWAATREGLESGELVAADAESYSTAVFFGLKPVSDQVWFVLDRSTSMTGRMPGDARDSRYQRAQQQLLEYLRASGPETRFGVTLFSDSPVTWRSRVTLANERNLKDLTEWLNAHPPDGETRLKPAIEEVLGWNPGRPYDVRRQVVDTIVVLCDGKTASGPGWVEGFQEEVGAASQVVFQCILVGTDGDGTLEALAEGSGGRLILVR